MGLVAQTSPHPCTHALHAASIINGQALLQILVRNQGCACSWIFTETTLKGSDEEPEHLSRDVSNWCSWTHKTRENSPQILKKKPFRGSPDYVNFFVFFFLRRHNGSSLVLKPSFLVRDSFLYSPKILPRTGMNAGLWRTWWAPEPWSSPPG